jgi:hypothetical protein
MMGISSPGLSWKDDISERERDASGLVHQSLGEGVGDGDGKGVGDGNGVGDGRTVAVGEGICARTRAGLSIRTAQSTSSFESQEDLARTMIFIFFSRSASIRVGECWWRVRE